MAMLAVAAIAAGGLMEAAGTIQQGNAANKQAKLEAAQMDSQANSVQGDAQRQMLQQRQQQHLAQSALLARAAAGGGDTSSAGFANLYGGLEAQGDYNALATLYNGDVKATGLRNQAMMTRYQGQLTKHASKIQAVAGLLKTAGSAGSMYAKYGASTAPASSGWYGSREMADSIAGSNGVTWGYG